MLCKQFCHIGLNDTGEGLIRNAIQRYVVPRNILKFVDSRAHLILRDMRAIWNEECPDEPFPPIMTGVRNPFDWRISFWMHQMVNRVYKGTFYDFCTKHEVGYLLPEFNTGPGVRMIDYWNQHGCAEANYVVKFETMKEDLVRIMPVLLQDAGIKKRDVLNWFPEAYTYWKGRQWAECIEQWMRKELCPPDLIERIYEEDHYFFERFGYSFEEHYEFD